MHPYERWITIRYLANGLRSKHVGRSRNPSEDILNWIAAHARPLGLAPLKWRWGSNDSGRTRANKADWTKWKAAVLAMAQAPEPPVSALQKRIDWLGDSCELTAAQRFLLGLFARITRSRLVCDLLAALNRGLGYD
ncbi:MAG: hypothetical protein J2P49_09865, partial [Methylocapsa sp.]|nr:hypothetical protein [Methylocapsa sp.]